MDDIEDLLQEARLEFLLHLRKIPDESTIMLCKLKIRGALWSYWRSMAQVYIPKYCYKQEINKLECISTDDLDVSLPIMPQDEALDEMEVAEFITSLSPKERTTVYMKLNGATNREIIPVIEMKGEPQMSRFMKQLREKAHLYFAP